MLRGCARSLRTLQELTGHLWKLLGQEGRHRLLLLQDLTANSCRLAISDSFGGGFVMPDLMVAFSALEA